MLYHFDLVGLSLHRAVLGDVRDRIDNFERGLFSPISRRPSTLLWPEQGFLRRLAKYDSFSHLDRLRICPGIELVKKSAIDNNKTNCHRLLQLPSSADQRSGHRGSFRYRNRPVASLVSAGVASGTYDIRTIALSAADFLLLAGIGGTIWGGGNLPSAKTQGSLDLGVFIRNWHLELDVHGGYGTFHTYGIVMATRHFSWEE
jgi:hypothetical protein